MGVWGSLYGHTKDERISRIYKEALPIKKKSMTSILEKWTKDVNGYFIDTDKETYMANKYIKNVPHHL